MAPTFPDKLSNMRWPWQPKEEPLGDPSIPSQYDLRYRYGGGVLSLPIEEIKGLQQCTSDCNWKWAMPASAAAVSIVALGGLTGLLRISGLINLAFKMGLAAVPANLFGRWAYMRYGDCEKHLPAVSNLRPQPTGANINTKLADMAGYYLPFSTNVAPYPGPAVAETGSHGRGKI